MTLDIADRTGRQRRRVGGSMKNKTNFVPLGNEVRQAEAAKTDRLRALRLAKETADKAAALTAAAAVPRKAPRARSTG
jgi:hypothetical protein